jgi:hypothetical protein
MCLIHPRGLPAPLSLALTTLAITLLATLLPAQPTAERGAFYRSEDPAFAVWIPRGLNRVRHQVEANKHADAVFRGSGSGLFQVAFSSCGVDTLDDFVTATRNGAEARFPGCECTVHEGEKAGAHDAVIVVFTKLTGKPRYTGYASVVTGVKLDTDTVLSIGSYCDKAKLDAALAQIRWMISTLRRTDRSGLDRDLGPRKLDTSTGLSYRPPRNAVARDAAAEGAAIFACRAADPGYVLAVHAAAERDTGSLLRARSNGLTRLGMPWSLPTDGGPRLTGGLYRAGDDRARALIVAEFPGDNRFVIQADGALATREVMTRAAEQMALTLRHVDMAAARAEVAAAVATLEEARKKRCRAEVAEQVRILARHAYLDEAAAALIGSLRALDDPAARIQAAAALTACDDADLLPDLLKAVRLAKNRRQDALLVKLLGALGTIRGEKAVSVLLDFARRGTAAQSAAAVRSLGRYEVKRDRVVKGLIKAMARAEADARKNDFSARERWITLGPAFRHALEQLTGQSFQTADAAKEWLRTQ